MKIIFAVLTLLVLGAVYIFGAVSYHRDYWPIPELRDWKQSVKPFIPSNGAVTDEYGRLIAFHGKQQIPCPPQTRDTMAILTIGQSNAANNAGQRYDGDTKVINYFAGKCYHAASPLLGSTGIGGDSWTLLGNKLIDAHIAGQVILIASAMSGTSILRWQDGADLNVMLQSVVTDVQKHYQITQVLWHQGEWDVGVLTRQQYAEKFHSLVSTIRKSRVDAPIYVSVASRCELTDIPWKADNEIAAAQKSLPDPKQGIFAGVNTDDLVGMFDRVDDCHFAGSGQEKMADAWVRILTLPPPD